jgi:hypothetical protein
LTCFECSEKIKIENVIKLKGSGMGFSDDNKVISKKYTPVLGFM